MNFGGLSMEDKYATIIYRAHRTLMQMLKDRNY